MLKPNYHNNILNVISSIEKYYGINNPNPTLPLLDNLLKKNYQNVVLMVFDALGNYNLEKFPDLTKDLINHRQTIIDSVFPPTTAAATTTLESGLSPAQHCWLGWSVHFKEIDANVNVFINNNSDSQVSYSYPVADTYIPYKKTIDKINELKQVQADSISPFGTIPYDGLEEMFDKIKNLCQDDQKRYLYVYHNEPDHSMHHHGITSQQVQKQLKSINDQVTEFTTNMKNTLVIVLADHGHIDCEPLKISDYPDFVDTLKCLPSIEPRAINLFVKDGQNSEFLALYQKYFSQDFLLLSKDEVIKEKLFGDSFKNMRYTDYLGDYLMIATNKKTLFNNDQQAEEMIGVHAGLTTEELQVPLLIYKS